MIKIKDKKVWFASDSHYSHKNICRGVSDWKDEQGNVRIESTRDFKTLEEMNDTIVNNINKVVEQEDVLIHFGDWSFGGEENIKKLRDRIFCKNIYLMIGNHDHHIQKNSDSVQQLFTHVSHLQDFLINNQMIVACHYPISSWNKLRRGSWMIHGHIHNKGNARFTGEGKTMDVGMDGHPEFRPYSFEEVKSLMDKRPIKSTVLEDYHE
jgi:calcineurin-like phosphoesterase family protein